MKFKNKIIQEAYNNMIDNIYSIAKVECPTITRGQTQEIINKFDKVKEKYKEYEY
jgi:tagatose-1,6-bisphosphate aldolase